MNWISEVVRPRIKTLFKRETPENLWIKCPDSGQMVFHKDVEANGFVIPGSDHHMRVTAQDRLRLTFDEGKWVDVPLPEAVADPLKFRDEKRYTDRIKDARAKTGAADAFKVGYGRVQGLPMTIAVQDFHFMGGSLGMAAGEAFIKGAETALESTAIGCAVCGSAEKNRLRSSCSRVWRRIFSSNSASSSVVGRLP